MKVVLDTNVLISGIYFGGLPGKYSKLGALAGSSYWCLLKFFRNT